MTNLPAKSFQNQDWYIALMEDCQAIITESVFNSRWSLIEGYHNLGFRLLEDYEHFNRQKIYGEEIVSHVAKSLGKSKRTIYNAVRFARTFPQLNDLPGGKNITWARICNDYLPKKKEKKECQHPEERRSYFYQCLACGQWVKIEQ